MFTQTNTVSHKNTHRILAHQIQSKTEIFNLSTTRMSALWHTSTNSETY